MGDVALLLARLRFNGGEETRFGSFAEGFVTLAAFLGPKYASGLPGFEESRFWFATFFREAMLYAASDTRRERL